MSIHAATTRISHEAFEAALWALHDDYGNPSSLHQAGVSAAKVVGKARSQIANYIGASPDEIVFHYGEVEVRHLFRAGLQLQFGRDPACAVQLGHNAPFRLFRP